MLCVYITLLNLKIKYSVRNLNYKKEREKDLYMMYVLASLLP